MLVVLLIIMVATASAMLALHTIQSEVQATGHHRIAVQARGVSDAAMVTAIAWIEQVGGGEDWRKEGQENGPPTMDPYPEPAILPLDMLGFSVRTTMATQRELNRVAASEVGVVCNAPAAAGGTGGSGGAGGAGGSGGSGGGGGAPSVYGCETAFDIDNEVGSFGPGQAYALPEGDGGYVVDFTDCIQAPNALAAGSPLGGDDAYEVVAFVCTVTARGRLEIGTANRNWQYGGADGYTQRVFSSAHDARAAIVTPEMIVPKGSGG